MFFGSVQRRGCDANDVPHHLALATEPSVCRLALQPKFLAPRQGREMSGSFHNLHSARAAQTVSLTIHLLVDPLVDGNIMEQRNLAEVRLLSAIHLLACIQELNHRHKSPLRLSNKSGRRHPNCTALVYEK